MTYLKEDVGEGHVRAFVDGVAFADHCCPTFIVLRFLLLSLSFLVSWVALACGLLFLLIISLPGRVRFFTFLESFFDCRQPVNS